MQHEGVSFFARILPKAWNPAPKTAFERGIVALERSRIDDALLQFEAALEAAATAVERAAIHNKRGIAHVRRGDRALAIDAFVDALTADERCVAAIVNVGNLLFEDGAVDEAIEHYEAALRIDDRYANAHRNLGVAFKRLGRRGDAVRALRRAGRLEASLRDHRAP